MTTLLLDCMHGSTKEGFANAARALVLPSAELPPLEAYVPTSDVGHEGDAIHAHHHHSIEEVHAVIEAAPVTEMVKRHARGVYAIIARAEAKAHGVSEADVHFHEVGAPEAIAHILAACDALSRIERDQTWATSVCTGFGFVECAHGTLPIPAPATANILESCPAFPGAQEGELTTPTGAALAVYFADGFIDRDAENIEADAIICCNPC